MRAGSHQSATARCCSLALGCWTAGAPPRTGLPGSSSPRTTPRSLSRSDAIFVRDGQEWTSAGVTAGMDLALALVEEDLGRDVALQIARRMVLFVKRPGGQSQFSAHLTGQRPGSGPLREVASWLHDNLAANLRAESLAERACMTTRNFSRAFRR